jgi:hypothetical protein
MHECGAPTRTITQQVTLKSSFSSVRRCVGLLGTVTIVGKVVERGALIC